MCALCCVATDSPRWLMCRCTVTAPTLIRKCEENASNTLCWEGLVCYQCRHMGKVGAWQGLGTEWWVLCTAGQCCLCAVVASIHPQVALGLELEEGVVLPQTTHSDVWLPAALPEPKSLPNKTTLVYFHGRPHRCGGKPSFYMRYTLV